MRSLFSSIALMTLAVACGNPASVDLTSKRTLDSTSLPDEVRDHERGCYDGFLHLDHEGCGEVEAASRQSDDALSETVNSEDENDPPAEVQTPPNQNVPPAAEDDDVVTTTPTPGPQLDPAANGDPNVVVFRIAPGSGGQSWNTRESMIVATVGQTIRFVNDDTVRHRLHTNGAPCAHGANFAPGETFDCVVSRAFDPDDRGPLYDHNDGPSSEVWLKTMAAPQANLVGVVESEAAAAGGHCGDH